MARVHAATSPAGAQPGAWSSREAYLLALFCLFLGLVAGYVFRGSSVSAQPAAAAQAPAPGGQAGEALHDPQAVKILAAPLLSVLELDPKNFDALTKLGNLYYDHHVYQEAVGYYRRALEIRPDEYNVRTDLGTAYWYSGFPREAIAEYELALKSRPGHAPTLMNTGIVRLEGLKDPAGAVAAWEELLRTNPEYPERPRVVQMIEQARRRSN